MLSALCVQYVCTEYLLCVLNVHIMCPAYVSTCDHVKVPFMYQKSSSFSCSDWLAQEDLDAVINPLHLYMAISPFSWLSHL